MWRGSNQHHRAERAIAETGRRTFLALLGASVATSASGAATAGEGEEDEESEADAAEDEEFLETDVSDLEPAEALLAYVESLYGERFDEEDRETILAGIEGSLASAEAFREVGLTNSDEPAYRFAPYRGEER